MSTLRRIGLVVVLASGCQPGVPDCDRLGAGLSEHIPAASDALVVNTRRADVARAVRRLCTQDRWGSEVRACMHAATTDWALEECRGRLSAAQQARVAEALGPAFDVSGSLRRQEEMLGAVEELADRMCRCQDLGCTYDVEHAVKDVAKRYSEVVLDDAGRARLKTLDARYGECMTKASRLRVSWAPTPAELPIVPVDDSLPAECQAYRELIVRLGDCTKIDGGIRAYFLDGYAKMAAAWKDVPPEKRGELATSCRTAVASLERYDPCLAEKPAPR